MKTEEGKETSNDIIYKNEKKNEELAWQRQGLIMDKRVFPEINK
jgi:hypothetical protein